MEPGGFEEEEGGGGGGGLLCLLLSSGFFFVALSFQIFAGGKTIVFVGNFSEIPRTRKSNIKTFEANSIIHPNYSATDNHINDIGLLRTRENLPSGLAYPMCHIYYKDEDIGVTGMGAIRPCIKANGCDKPTVSSVLKEIVMVEAETHDDCPSETWSKDNLQVSLFIFTKRFLFAKSISI